MAVRASPGRVDVRGGALPGAVDPPGAAARTVPAPLPPDRVAAVEVLMGRVVPFIGLGMSVILTVLLDRGHRTPALQIAAVVAVWMVIGTVMPGWAGRSLRTRAVYYVVLTVATFTLCLLGPWFGFLTAAGYAGAKEFLLGRWRLAGVGATAVAASLAQGGGLDGISRNGFTVPVLMLFVNVPIAGGLAWLGWLAEAASQRQQRHIIELTAAYEQLERLTAENTGLHAQLLLQAREAGMLDERARLAREIHDTLAQGLTGIIAQLRAALGLLEAPDAAERAERDRHLRTALDLARESLAEARRSVRAMTPRPLEAATLSTALQEAAAAWSNWSGVRVEVRVTGTPVPLHGELETALLRTVQEALANVAKHARASRVVVTLSYLGDEVALDILDDGIGFDVVGASARSPIGVGGGVDDRTPGRGFGLLSMRQRVQRVAGTFEIDSEPGGGTAVSARVPAIGA